MSEDTAIRTVVVSHPNGLCMRGASSICQLAGCFQSKIELVNDGHRVSATDALEIVLLTAESGSQVVLEATGADADEALDALVTLFGNDFGLIV